MIDINPHSGPTANRADARRLPALTGLLAALMVGALIVFASPTAADDPLPAELWQRCDLDEPQGQACLPGGVAANPSTRHAYIADGGNKRVIEFTAWGEFIRAWGWDVVAAGPGDTPADQFEVCVPNDGDTCQQGTGGSGVGQFQFATGLAIDSTGDVYVADAGTARVQKFSADGEFELMFGGGVNQGPNNPGDICTAAHVASGDTCAAGTQGTDPGEFGQWALGDQLATGPSDEIYVGDQGRIQRFDTSGVYQGEIAVPGETVYALATSPTGDLYVSFGGGSTAEDDVHKLSPAGAPLGTLTVNEPTALATDVDGKLYVVEDSQLTGGSVDALPRTKLLEFNAAGTLLKTYDPRHWTTSGGLDTAVVTDQGDVAIYVGFASGFELDEGSTTSIHTAPSRVEAFGPIPDPDLVGPPPSVAPTIAHSYARTVDTTTATLAARINPHFWGDASYYLEYGPADCSVNPCTKVGFPGTPLAAGIVDSAKTVEVPLANLAPDTTYHYRFVAQSSGGGPAFGPDKTFTTFPPAPPARSDCPNQAFRTGPSAGLPDCRAYEMVSPVDKNGGDARAPRNPEGIGGQNIQETAHFEATASGSKLTYNAATAFADAKAGAFAIQYLAARGADGWSSRALNPAQGKNIDEDTIKTLHNMFDAFTPDLNLAWHLFIGDPQPDPAGVAGYVNLYRRDNTTDAFTAVTTVTPPTRAPGAANNTGYWPALAGFSADGARTVFAANDRLVAGASSAVDVLGHPIYQLYERAGSTLRLVSRLPDNSASSLPSFAGGGRSYLQGAVSDDGQKVWWTAGDDLAALQIGTVTATFEVTGKVYLRSGGTTTIPVSETASAGRAHFWAARPDGSAALFSIVEDGSPEEGNLYRFDAANPLNPTLLATGVERVGGASSDLGRIYFSSFEVLDSDPNSAGDTAQAGRSNIYYLEAGGEPVFVAAPRTLNELFGRDVGMGVGPFTENLDFRLSRVSGDGRHLVFAAHDAVTGADQLGAATALPAQQVFRYDAEADRLDCVSCNPAGARPVVSERGDWPILHVAANIPGWRQGSFHQQRYMTDDGSRVFFKSFDRLLPEDQNGRTDVYQWTDPGNGECTTQSAYYFAANGGCLALLSTATYPGDSEFIEATPDGSTVFIRTAQGLLPQDKGQLDIYGARIGGGFAPPPAPPADCEGLACQGEPAPAPAPPVAASLSFEGAGNETPRRSPESASGKVRATKPRPVRGFAARLRVKVPAPGTLTVSGTRIRKVTKRVSEPGTVTITVRLAPRAIRALKRKRSLKARVRVRFDPAAGAASATTLVVTFKKPRSTTRSRTRGARANPEGAQ